MNNSADILMLHGVTRECPDCGGERMFVPTDDRSLDTGELGCTECGAAYLADPVLVYVAEQADISAA